MLHRVCLLLCAVALPVAAAPPAELRFENTGELVRTVSLAELREACEAHTVEIAEDPYYARRKRFHALPLGCVLERGFGAPVPADPDANYFLRARDGYVKPASGARLTEPTGFLAFADADLTRGADLVFEPIDRRQLEPGPFYVVWTGAGQNDTHRYPWPYQLAAIERAPFEARFPRTRPSDAPEGGGAWRGYAIFQRECISCHAINGEGGRVGPDLNLPQSIVDYRPAEQIRAFVRNPETFRYTSMPAHEHLTDADLDALLAYLRAMSERKQRR